MCVILVALRCNALLVADTEYQVVSGIDTTLPASMIQEQAGLHTGRRDHASETMYTPFQLADVLHQLMRRPNLRYTPGLVSKLSGVPKATIVNWLEGQVRKPRRWQDLVRVADALRLSRSLLYELIRSGQLRTVKAGRRRLVPVEALAEYVARLKDAA